MSRDPEKAVEIAATILYLDDNSDYGTALYEVIEALGGREAIEKSSLSDEIKAYILDMFVED